MLTYYDFCESARFNMSWTALKFSHTYGTSVSAKTFFTLLVDEASLLASKLSLNHKLCEALAYAYAFSFCNGGDAGWRAIDECLREQGFNVDLTELKISVIEARLRGVNKKPPEELYGYARELFGEGASLPEIAAVKECYRILKALEPVAATDLELYYSLEEKAIAEIQAGYGEKGAIIQVELAKYIPADMQKLPDELSPGDKKDFSEALREKLSELSEDVPREEISKPLTDEISYFALW